MSFRMGLNSRAEAYFIFYVGLMDCRQLSLHLEISVIIC